MKNKQQAGFASILLILFGLTVIGGGLYFYKQNNSTQNSKTEFINYLPSEDGSIIHS
jgi:hypothetical protein